jgi:hypothetical protein
MYPTYAQTRPYPTYFPQQGYRQQVASWSPATSMPAPPALTELSTSGTDNLPEVIDISADRQADIFSRLKHSEASHPPKVLEAREKGRWLDKLRSPVSGILEGLVCAATFFLLLKPARSRLIMMGLGLLLSMMSLIRGIVSGDWFGALHLAR